MQLVSILFFLLHSISRTNVTSGNKIGEGYVKRKAYCLLFHTIAHFASISLFLFSRFYAPAPCPSRFVISYYCTSSVFRICASFSFKSSCTQADIIYRSMTQVHSICQILRQTEKRKVFSVVRVSFIWYGRYFCIMSFRSLSHGIQR